MNDVIVSARMPKSLVKELKSLIKEQHFLDLSEQVRSIVRKKWIKHTNPELFELKKLSEDIQSELRKKTKARVQEQINKELEKIKLKLKKEDLLDV